MNVVLQFGVEGAQATILPIALVLLGILSIAQPVHRIFYGVIALAISVYSIAGVNLGGWVVGFLLGVIGGIVVVSWAPPAAADEAEGAEPVAEAEGAEPERGGTRQPGKDDADGTADDDGGTADGDAPRAERAGAPAVPVADADESDCPGAEPSQTTRPPRRPRSRTTAHRATTASRPRTRRRSPRWRRSAARCAHCPRSPPTVVVASAMAIGGMSLPASTSGAETQQDDSFWCVVFGACDDDGATDPSASPSPSPSVRRARPSRAKATDPVGDAVDDVTGGATDPADGEGAAGDGPARRAATAPARPRATTRPSARSRRRTARCPRTPRRTRRPTRAARSTRSRPSRRRCRPSSAPASR